MYNTLHRCMHKRKKGGNLLQEIWRKLHELLGHPLTDKQFAGTDNSTREASRISNPWHSGR